QIVKIAHKATDLFLSERMHQLLKNYAQAAVLVQGVRVVAARYERAEMREMHEFAQHLRAKLIQPAVVVLGAVVEDRRSVLVGASSPAFADLLPIHELIKTLCDGAGGGNPSSAQGSVATDKLDKALGRVSGWVLDRMAPQTGAHKPDPR